MNILTVGRKGLLALAVFSALTVRAERIALTNGHASCELDTQGARILSYRVGAVEVLWTSPGICSVFTPCRRLW